MNKIFIALKWVMRNSFPITLAYLLAIYAYWFRLTPFVFLNVMSDDPSFSFLGGIMVLVISGTIVRHTWQINKQVNAYLTMLFASIVFLLTNLWYIQLHIPRIITTETCNGVTYYSTYGSPLTDEQWTYTQLAKWKGLFSYESSFYGYAPSSWANKIVCDEGKKEANIIDHFPNPGLLKETDGENPRNYYTHAIARLRDHLYFISRQCPNESSDIQPTACKYTLYQCKLNYTACYPLPVVFEDEYERYDEDFFMEVDDLSDTIRLYKDYSKEWKTLIFLYGKESTCYIEGCSINGQ